MGTVIGHNICCVLVPSLFLIVQCDISQCLEKPLIFGKARTMRGASFSLCLAVPCCLHLTCGEWLVVQWVGQGSKPNLSSCMREIVVILTFFLPIE